MGDYKMNDNIADVMVNPWGTFIIGDDFWVQLDDPSDEWQFLDPVILKFTREQVELLDELIGRKL